MIFIWNLPINKKIKSSHKNKTLAFYKFVSQIIAFQHASRLQSITINWAPAWTKQSQYLVTLCKPEQPMSFAATVVGNELISHLG